MDKSEFEECPPSVSMIESLRNIGYDFNYAIADLLDNSISFSKDSGNVFVNVSVCSGAKG